MGKMKILCPNCKDKLLVDNQCQQCDYNTKYDQFLITNLLSSYNLSINLISQKRIVEAWEELQKHLNQYPFIIDYLNLAFILSLINGDYNVSAMILKRLKTVINDKEYQEYFSLLNTNIEVYNKIVNEKCDLETIEDYNLSLFHFYILFLQNKGENKSNILREINKIDPHFSSKLTHGHVFPKLSTVYKIALTTIIGITGIMYNYYEYTERQKLRLDYNGLELSLKQVHMQKDSLDFLLSQHNDSLHTLYTNLEIANIEINQKKKNIGQLKARKKEIEAANRIKEKEIERLREIHRKTEENYNNHFSRLSNSNKNLIENNQGLINNNQVLSDNIHKQQELLQSAIDERISAQKETEILKIKHEQLEAFMTRLNNNQFIQSANYLSEKVSVDYVIDNLGVVGVGYIDNLCDKLYSTANYEEVLSIKYSCEKSADSFYRLYLKDQSNPRRIEYIEQFIEMFQPNNTKYYSAPLLEELIYYYKKTNNILACNYFDLLEEHIVSFPAHNKWVTSRINNYLKECN